MRTFLAVSIMSVALGACATNQQDRQVLVQRDEEATAAAQALIRGDHAEALRLADVALAKRPGAPWLLYDKGSALAALGRTDEALAVLREAEAKMPARDVHGRSVAIYRRGLALEYAGRCAEASTEMARYAGLVKSPQLSADVAEHTRYCIGPTAEQAARRQEAAALAASMADPKRKQVMDASTAAVVALTQSDYTTALARAEQGLAVAPDDAWLLYNKGTALTALGRVDEGTKVLREAEDHFAPSDLHGRSVAAYGRALTLEGAGRCQEAAREYDHYAAITGAKGEEAAHLKTHLRMCLRATGRETL
jgi:tetratricopeptide (TPR) repeat protein